jgi:hypothetical protein
MPITRRSAEIDGKCATPTVSGRSEFARPTGDLDTHGLAILSRARLKLPHLESALMDEHTLLRHRDLWVSENPQYAVPELPLLTPAEQSLYCGLKQQRWGVNVRLEQERIAWNYAWDVLLA